MKQITLFFWSLLITFQLTYGQVTIKGYVYDKETQEPLIGVTVIEKDTENGTTTNLDGYFELEVNTTPIALVFSYVGAITKEELITDADKSHKIELIENFVNVKEIILNSNGYRKLGRIGIQSGINYTPYGLHLSNVTPYLFKQFVLFKTSFTYMTNFQENSYLNVSLSKLDLLNNYDFTLHLNARYNQKKFRIDQIDWLIQEYNITSLIQIRRQGLTLGYGYQSVDNQEVDSGSHGLVIGLGSQIYRTLYAESQIKYWGDYWQYTFKMSYEIPKTKLELNTAFEKVLDYKEWQFGVSYRFFY